MAVVAGKSVAAKGNTRRGRAVVSYESMAVARRFVCILMGGLLAIASMNMVLLFFDLAIC